MKFIIPQTKVCKKCRKVKPLSDFYKQINARSGSTIYNTNCKKCSIKIASVYYEKVEKKAKRERYKLNPEHFKEKSIRYKRNHPLKYLVVSAKHRAKERGLEFDITEGDLVVPEFCPYLGIKIVLRVSVGGKGIVTPDSASIDRIDPTKGYVQGNVQIISHLANRMKSNANQEQLISFSENVLRMSNKH